MPSLQSVLVAVTILSVLFHSSSPTCFAFDIVATAQGTPQAALALASGNSFHKGLKRPQGQAATATNEHQNQNHSYRFTLSHHPGQGRKRAAAGQRKNLKTDHAKNPRQFTLQRPVQHTQQSDYSQQHHLHVFKPKEEQLRERRQAVTAIHPSPALCLLAGRNTGV